MSPTTNDLREALARSVKSAPAGTERLAGVRRVVARRRRARLAGGGALAVALAAGVLGVVQPGARQAAPPASSLITGLPTYDEGGRLLAQTQLPAIKATVRTFTFTPTSYELRLVATCTQSTTVPGFQTVINGKVATFGPCTNSYRGVFEDGERTWRGYGITPGVPASVTITVTDDNMMDEDSYVAPPASKSTAPVTVRVGVYQDVPADQYPLPPRPSQVTPPPADAWTRSSSTPSRDVVTVQPGAPTGTVSRTLPYHSDLAGEARTWAPGLVRLLVNGKVVTGAAVWTYDPRAIGFDLTPANLKDAGIPVPKDGEPFTLTVQTERFQDPAWRVQIGRP